jgi:hypothetical protein
MISSKRMMFLNIFLLVLSASALWVSCPMSPEEDNNNGNNSGYVDNTAIINVDYNGANNAVFFDFSTGTRTVLPHDFFDIAIDAGANIIANSGSYGSGIQVYKTDSTDIAADFSGHEDEVKEYTFTGTLDPAKLYGYQSELNPLGKLKTTTSNVCLIKVQYKTADTAAYFKVVFSMTMGPTQSYNMTVVPGLAGGEIGKREIKAAVSGVTAGYGWLYFKLVGEGGPRALNNGTTWTGGGTAVPKAADWDILGTMTDELTNSQARPQVNRSSILLNTYKAVKVKAVTGKSIYQVSKADMSDDGLSGEIDAIGYGWHSTGAGMLPTYSVPDNTYVIKTAEGDFAKFQPKTFAKDGRSFVMDFVYSYKSGE